MALIIQNSNENTSANDNPVRKVWSAPELSPINVVDITNNRSLLGDDGGASTTDRF